MEKEIDNNKKEYEDFDYEEFWDQIDKEKDKYEFEKENNNNNKLKEDKIFILDEDTNYRLDNFEGNELEVVANKKISLDSNISYTNTNTIFDPNEIKNNNKLNKKFRDMQYQQKYIVSKKNATYTTIFFRIKKRFEEEYKNYDPKLYNFIQKNEYELITNFKFWLEHNLFKKTENYTKTNRVNKQIYDLFIIMFYISKTSKLPNINLRIFIFDSCNNFFNKLHDFMFSKNLLRKKYCIQMFNNIDPMVLIEDIYNHLTKKVGFNSVYKNELKKKYDDLRFNKNDMFTKYITDYWNIDVISLRFKIIIIISYFYNFSINNIKISSRYFIDYVNTNQNMLSKYKDCLYK